MRQFRTWLMKQLEKLLLMPDYFRALAKEWLNILFGETLVGIGFLVWWSLGAPTNHALVVVFVIAMFVAGYYAWRAHHARLTPRLEICGACVQDTPVLGDLGLPVGMRTFIQVMPRCLTDAPIYECEGHLRQVRKWSKSKNIWEPTVINEPLQLRWSQMTPSAITLHPGVERNLNIFYVQHGTWDIILEVHGEIPPRAASVFYKSPGCVYRFDLEVTGSDRINGSSVSLKATRVTLEVDIGNDPLSPRLEFV
jgi:hypothetical protein